MAIWDGEQSPGTARSESRKTLANNDKACLEAELWELGEQTLRQNPFDTPSPALSGLGRATRSPKQHQPELHQARQRRVESPRIASFYHFTVCFTFDAAHRAGPGARGDRPSAPRPRLVVPCQPPIGARQRSHINNMLTIFP
ncbi:hypothetical protein CFAM422_009304 [Trichoderma lentiforme]|uniref:Uncharacterized protein n=1 Tax=Trichoderma lentiforme TaxID=1567552 RepID=A0A9P5C957_9HYPO|nr:hypothetical protein CFAM422_009304 [Trichoderma lentiforme]